MSIQYDSLVQQVLALPIEDRASLAKTVIESLDDETPDEVHAAWIEEIDSRMAAIERGEVEFLDGEEYLAKMRKKYSP